MGMTENLDKGDLLKAKKVIIEVNFTNSDLERKLANIGCNLLIMVLFQLQKFSLKLNKQNDRLAIYAKKIQKKEAKIDWSMKAKSISRCIRAFNSWPTSFFNINDRNYGQIKIYKSNDYQNNTFNTFE